jgi:hypothetical protein
MQIYFSFQQEWYVIMTFTFDMAFHFYLQKKLQKQKRDKAADNSWYYHISDSLCC